MPIPTRTECYALIHQMEMPEHIVAHSLQVCRVAELLAEALIRQGSPLNAELVTASALLHDITKPQSFTTGEDHCATGEAFLSDRGYVAVGRIVGQHVRLDAYPADMEPAEAGVVNYADKRVLHDRVVSLGRRMAYIRERYGRTPDHRRRIDDLWKASIGMEERIFRDLPFAPDDVSARVGDVADSPEMKAFCAAWVETP